MATIQKSVQELKDINLEIKRLKTLLTQLKNRSGVLEKNILSYLNEKDIPGVKDKDTAVIIENKKKRINISRKNTELECLKILQSHGIDNAETVLKEISEARKGQSIPLQKVKLTEITR
jgi:hypothetical protein